MTSPVSPSETIAKAMEGVTPGPWELHNEIDGPETQTRIKSGRKALATTAAQCGRSHHQNEQVANATYIAACSPDRMREVLDELYALREAALQLEAMQREMAELRRALEMISAESKESNEPIGRSVFKALATCGEIADVALRARTLTQGEKP